MSAAVVARFLSPEWFAEVARFGPPRPTAAPADLVLEQVVYDTPEGEVRYRVVVTGRAAYIEPPRDPSDTRTGGDGTDSGSGRVAGSAPDLTITCDWATATRLAQGTLSAQAALTTGRLRVRGNLARLSGRAANLAGLDPVPPGVRRRTTFPEGPGP